MRSVNGNTVVRWARENRLELLPYAILVVLLPLGALTISPKLVSWDFLSLQLIQATILGCVAAGQLLVILTGKIDLSVSWTLNIAAIVATSVYSGGTGLQAIACGLGVGALVGLVNAFGVAYLRIPAIIFTLAVNSIVKGLTVIYVGSTPVYHTSPPILGTIATGTLLGTIPTIAIVWAILAVIIIVFLERTASGQRIRAVGNNPVAAYLSGIRTKRSVFLAFILSGVCNAAAGLLLVGYSGRSFNLMGEPYQMPAIAAVVVGGASIAGGYGSYAGVIGGVLLLTVLSSVMSIMQIPTAGRYVVWGAIVLAMIAYTGKKDQS